nr:proteasome activator complex subunit 4B-like [Nothobranchius furzeri]
MPIAKDESFLISKPPPVIGLSDSEIKALTATHPFQQKPTGNSFPTTPCGAHQPCDLHCWLCVRLSTTQQESDMTDDGKMNEDGDEAWFVPQKEIVYNSLLPYCNHLDQEAMGLLEGIKANLSRAVLVRELFPGVAFWSRKLFFFLKLYGRRFTKEDHILFIKLLYELVTLPNLEPHMMQCYARLLIQLLKKKELLSRDDLQLPWRPLYNLYERVIYSKTEDLGLVWFPKCVVKYTCSYSTLLALQLSGPNSEGCDQKLQTHLVNLFARLANDNIGYVDWTAYIPTIFTRILRRLNLPVGVSQMVAPRYLTNSYDIGYIVLWITALLGGPGNPAQKELTCLFSSIASFYHPSNHGRWQLDIMFAVSTVAVASVTPSECCASCALGAICCAMLDPNGPQGKTGSTDAAYALQNLALLTPELVIPPVLEKTYAAMETLTEPHTLTATLSCMIGMARSLVSNNDHYPEGRVHVLPLLMGSLPGVDPNDFSKCMKTFQFITTFTTLVPLVDGSSAPSQHTDLTEIEKDLCFASAGFEDFVLQFLDRCFALIDSSTLEQTRDEMETDTQTHLESLVELGLSSTVSTILTQCSTEIYKSETKFLKENTAVHISSVCLESTNSQHKSYQGTLQNEELQNEDELDKELLWNLQLLSELLKYQRELEQILCVCVRLRCRQAYTLACSLLEHTLQSLSLIYPTEYCSTAGGFDMDLPIRDWGRAGDVAALGVCWHVPSQEEENFVFQLLSSLLHPELRRIQHHVSGDQPVTREELWQSLAIVQHCLLGAGSMLPPLDGEHVPDLVPSLVNLREIELHAGVEFDDSRENYNYILEQSEDDTKSLFVIIKIISGLMFFRGTHKKEFESRWKSFTLVKTSMENPLHGEKQHIRALLVDRVLLQHEMRNLVVEGTEYKVVHQELLCDLLLLSTSTYSQVRSRAQSVLMTAMGTYGFCYRDMVPRIVQILSPLSTTDTQQQFKGALYCILGTHNGFCPAITRDWDCIGEVWSALVRCGLSHSMILEKPSIGQLFDDIIERIHRQYDTIGFIRCAETASQIAQSSSLELSSKEEMKEGIQRQRIRNVVAARKYEKLVNDLLDCLEDKDLYAVFQENNFLVMQPWKFDHMATDLLALLLRDDHPLPPDAVLYFTQSIVHDSITIRKSPFAEITDISILSEAQQMAESSQTETSHNTGNTLQTITHSSGIQDPEGICVGDREGNHWLQYESPNLPLSQELWDSLHYVEKTHWGYYSWPREMMIYAASEKPQDDLPYEEMSEVGAANTKPLSLASLLELQTCTCVKQGEKIIFEYFSDPDFVEQLMEFLSLEERKGKDSFNPRRFCLFKAAVYLSEPKCCNLPFFFIKKLHCTSWLIKPVHLIDGLFRNYGDRFLPILWPHLDQLASDPYESSQRCVCEITAGLIRGSKHWSFSKVDRLWQLLCPLIRTALNNITVETYTDWGTCIATACYKA